jgi:hypothetical protein
MLAHLHSPSVNLIICGDVNINYLQTSSSKNQLDSLLALYNLNGVVNFPTRITESSSTAIDNFFMDKGKNAKYSISPIYNGLSDHDAQLLVLHDAIINNQVPHSTIIRQINENTIAQFKLNLSYENWSETFTEDNIDINYKNFLNTYLRIFNSTFPHKRIYPNRNRNAWITKGIKISCKRKEALYILSKSTQNPKLRSYYKTYSKILSEVIKTAKKMHYHNLLSRSHNKVKTMWNLVKVEINKQNRNNVPPLNIEGSPANDYQELARVFNEYFINATNLAQTGNLKDNSSAVENLNTVYNGPFEQIDLTPVTAQEIKNIIRSLKWTTSSGYDEVPPRLLKLSLPYIISPLTYLCNKSLISGIFPSWLKYSQVTPIPKKGNKFELSNYRPISLLTSFSKIFEKVIYKRLINHTSAHNILSKAQYGFRSKMSTDNAIYQLTNNILKALDNKQLVGGMFCDLSKAFDCVDHETLLSKLEYYGVRGTANKLIKSYLVDRSQRVLIKDNYSGTYYSEWNKVKRGVPQGSVLGPLFFLLYINDLPETIEDTSLPTLFADDINLICVQRSLEGLKDGYASVLTKVNRWFQSNSLTLNLKKTNLVHFTAKPTTNIPDCIELGQNQLINSQTINFLGLTLDYTLSWRPHIARIGNQLRTACYILRILKPTLTAQNLKMIYFAYFHSIMSYGIIFWGNSTDNDEIFKLQKRAIRIMTNSSTRTSCRGLFKELGILPLCSQYILSLGLFVAKNREDFIINSDIHPHNTRFNTNLHPSLARLTKYQKGAYYSGTKIYNCLPTRIKQLSGDVNKFKLALKKFLSAGSFYSIEEFLQWSTLGDLNAMYS